jgi:hypothetical protein
VRNLPSQVSKDLHIQSLDIRWLYEYKDNYVFLGGRGDKKVLMIDMRDNSITHDYSTHELTYSVIIIGEQLIVGG